MEEVELLFFSQLGLRDRDCVDHVANAGSDQFTTFALRQLLVVDLSNDLDHVAHVFRARGEVLRQEVGTREGFVLLLELFGVLAVLDHFALPKAEGAEGLLQHFLAVDDRVTAQADQDLANSEDGSVSDVEGLAVAFLSEGQQDLLDDQLRVEDAEHGEGLGSQDSHRGLVVGQLRKGQVSHHALEVLAELTHEAGHVQIGIHAVRQREVVSFCQNFNAFWEGTLATNTLLESSTGGSAAVDFAVEEGGNDELSGESGDMGLHDFRGVSSCETPDHIASSVSDMGTDRVVSLVYIVHQSLVQDRYVGLQTLRQQKASSAELSEG
mmetsp:Transcript_17897/g.27663  ORF Transcript_17897/g.27663 Transcript_17897/m.27663 type:complete len:324 (+) Transcript_17897:1554-2525(+)